MKQTIYLENQNKIIFNKINNNNRIIIILTILCLEILLINNKET